MSCGETALVCTVETLCVISPSFCVGAGKTSIPVGSFIKERKGWKHVEAKLKLLGGFQSVSERRGWDREGDNHCAWREAFAPLRGSVRPHRRAICYPATVFQHLSTILLFSLLSQFAVVSLAIFDQTFNHPTFSLLTFSRTPQTFLCPKTFIKCRYLLRFLHSISTTFNNSGFFPIMS